MRGERKISPTRGYGKTYRRPFGQPGFRLERLSAIILAVIDYI
jgi:hypothetical protein